MFKRKNVALLKLHSFWDCTCNFFAFQMNFKTHLKVTFETFLEKLSKMLQITFATEQNQQLPEMSEERHMQIWDAKIWSSEIWIKTQHFCVSKICISFKVACAISKAYAIILMQLICCLLHSIQFAFAIAYIHCLYG